MRHLAGRLACPDITTQVVNPDDGPFAIETIADRAVAEPRVIDIVREASLAGTQAFVMACFDDIGVAAARRIAPGPVFDACEAGIVAARSLAERFAVVTTMTSAVTRIESLVDRYGASLQCSVRAAGIGVAEAASGAGEAKLHAAIAQAIERDSAEAIILGSGGLSGQADDLSAHFGVPVIDGVGAAISICSGVLRLAGHQRFSRKSAPASAKAARGWRKVKQTGNIRRKR